MSDQKGKPRRIDRAYYEQLKANAKADPDVQRILDKMEADHGFEPVDDMTDLEKEITNIDVCFMYPHQIQAYDLSKFDKRSKNAFITGNEIKVVQEAETDDRIKSAIGTHVEYYFLTENGNGLCGLPAVMVGMRKDPASEEDGPFFIDLGIHTPVPEIYVYLKDLRVLTLKVDRLDGSEAPISVAKADEMDDIIRITEEYLVDRKKHLSLVKTEEPTKPNSTLE
jgi:hypothetical protein